MKWFMHWFDKGLFALANYRAAKFPHIWTAYKMGGEGEWRLGEMTQWEAIALVTKDGAHKIKYVDPDQGVVIYD